MRRPWASAGLFFILIIFIIQLINPIEPQDYTSWAGSTRTITGLVCRKEHRLKGNELTSIIYVCFQGKEQAICYLSPSSTIPSLGDTIKISGRIRCFDTATNPGNFDAKRYYQTFNISIAIHEAEVMNTIPTTSLYWKLMERLNTLKRNLSILCDLTFDTDDSAILKTMLLGDKSAISPDTKSLYSRNGISHILAISGLHISMIGMAIYTGFKKINLPNLPSSIFAILLMILYGLMTGMAAGSCRAIIMFALRIIAPLFHRTYDMLTALITAAVLLLIEQPLYLFYTGFQFSFVAVAATAVILPMLKDEFPQLISGGISICIATLPIYLYNYFYFPIYSLLINLIVIPLMSIMLFCSLLALAISIIYIPAGNLVSLIPHIILVFYDKICHIIDVIPFNRMVTGKPQPWQIMIYCLIVGITLFFINRTTRLQLMLNLIAAGLILTLHFVPSGVHFTAVDVGQGDSLYIQDEYGTSVLIDGGSTSVSDLNKYRLSPYLLSQGVSHLDAVFITHMDADHYNGILDMIIDHGTNSPQIDSLILTTSEIEGQSDAYKEIVKEASHAKIPILNITQGDFYQRGRVKLYCLYPDSTCNGKDTNSESLVMLLDGDGGDILLTGDIESPAEQNMTTKIISDPLILKVAHHGSKYSTSNEFLSTWNPDLALISAGKDNSYGHPHKEMLDRLAQRNIPYFCTTDYGAITIRIQNGNIYLTSYLPAKDQDFSKTAY